MRDLAMEVTVDAVGNVVATRPGEDRGAAAVMIGSHIDTVSTGGRFDGNLGVLAGLEVVEVLERHGVRTRHPISVALFTDEEGARFAPDMLGSLVYVGGLALEEALDRRAVDDDARLGDELVRIGYAGPTPCPAATAPHTFVELHIEQGPVLERAGIDIGVVTGVQGISWTELTVTGQSAHAGTTPMHLRHDAALVAAELAVATRRIVDDIGGAQVGTVGRLELSPGLTNVVANRASLTVDLRNTDAMVLASARERLRLECDRLVERDGVRIEARSLADLDPVDFDATTVGLVETTAGRLGLSTMRLPSGAGHDAQMLARICPTAMIFVPSVGGLSHNIAELTHPHQIEAGANVLLHVALDRAVAV
jgi:N-carbamoyl-L-amino-acid hydrolase